MHEDTLHERSLLQQSKKTEKIYIKEKTKKLLTVGQGQEITVIVKIKKTTNKNLKKKKNIR